MLGQSTKLLTPDVALFPTWTECVADYARYEDMNGSGAWWIDGFDSSLESCLSLIAKAEELRTDPPAGLVVSDCFWIGTCTDVIGFLMLRHSLDNDLLRTEGGHIGYSIRPSFRRRGHASRALRLALDKADTIGLDRVLVTCAEDNAASARTIERQGGVFESRYNAKLRYWIDTRPRD